MFGNITINGFTGKHFILFCTLFMDLIYKLDLVLTAIPLPELRKIAEDCGNLPKTRSFY